MGVRVLPEHELQLEASRMARLGSDAVIEPANTVLVAQRLISEQGGMAPDMLEVTPEAWQGLTGTGDSLRVAQWGESQRNVAIVFVRPENPNAISAAKALAASEENGPNHYRAANVPPGEHSPTTLVLAPVPFDVDQERFVAFARDLVLLTARTADNVLLLSPDVTMARELRDVANLVQPRSDIARIGAERFDVSRIMWQQQEKDNAIARFVDRGSAPRTYSMAGVPMADDRWLGARADRQYEGSLQLDQRPSSYSEPAFATAQLPVAGANASSASPAGPGPASSPGPGGEPATQPTYDIPPVVYDLPDGITLPPGWGTAETAGDPNATVPDPPAAEPPAVSKPFSGFEPGQRKGGLRGLWQAVTKRRPS